jgi:hypothetical protein
LLHLEVSAKNYIQTKILFESIIKNILADIQSGKLNPYEENNGI